MCTGRSCKHYLDIFKFFSEEILHGAPALKDGIKIAKIVEELMNL